MIIIIEQENPPSVVFHDDERQAQYLIPADLPLELLDTVKAEKLIIDTRSDYEPPNLEASQWIAAFISKARALSIPIENRTWGVMTDQEAWESVQLQVNDFSKCFSPRQTTPERARELLTLLDEIEGNVKFSTRSPERWETGATLLAKVADIRDQLRELLHPPGAA